MRSTRFGMAFCAMLVLALLGSACSKATAIATATGPSPLPPCNNSCTGGSPTTPAPPLAPSPGSRPGDFTITGVSCTANSSSRQGSASWSASSGASYYEVEWRQWSTGPWGSSVRVEGRLNISQVVSTDASVYGRVWAVNAHGRTLATPSEREVCPEIRPTPVATPPPGPGPGTGPGPGPSPGPGPPPSGGSCSGASASLPDLTGRGQTRGFNVSSPSGCPWTLTSNNHHVVSVNPASGTTSASGSVTSLNAGTATICFVVGGVQVSCRTYTIP